MSHNAYPGASAGSGWDGGQGAPVAGVLPPSIPGGYSYSTAPGTNPGYAPTGEAKLAPPPPHQHQHQQQHQAGYYAGDPSKLQVHSQAQAQAYVVQHEQVQQSQSHGYGYGNGGARVAQTPGGSTVADAMPSAPPLPANLEAQVAAITAVDPGRISDNGGGGGVPGKGAGGDHDDEEVDATAPATGERIESHKIDPLPPSV